MAAPTRRLDAGGAACLARRPGSAARPRRRAVSAARLVDDGAGRIRRARRRLARHPPGSPSTRPLSDSMRRFLPHLLLLAAVALLCLVSAKAWMADRGPTTLRPQEPAGQSAPAAVPADPADAVPPPVGPRRSVPSAVGSMTARLAVLVLASDDGRPVSGVGVQV